MNCTRHLLRSSRCSSISSNVTRRAKASQAPAFPSRPARRPFSVSSCRCADKQQPGDAPEFVSILDAPPKLVRIGRKHGPGLIILALIPVTAFLLGTWQIKRLEWKNDLIAKSEDRLVRDPLPLPPVVDPDAIHDFDYRRVYATGCFRHDKEMLIGPRMHDGDQGFLVITPLERKGDASTILVNRGWISKEHRDQQTRLDGLPTGEVTVQGLLREPWKKNMFTPDNRPDINEFYFPDIKQMAELTGSQPVWIEATADLDYLHIMDFKAHGFPLGRAAEVNLTNNHAQYIFTWYALSLATSIMLWMVIKKPRSDVSRRIRAQRGL